MYSRTLAQNDYEKISQSLINKIPYDAFVACLKLKGNGIFIDAESTGDDIIVTARYVTNSSLSGRATLSSITVSNAIPVDYNFKIGTVLAPFNSISGLFKKINPKQEVLITINFSGFVAETKRIKPSRDQNTNMPVGTIIASCLDYASFCLLNDILSSGKNDELIWVPADGRLVNGSKYADLQSKVPDLRGVFLRGINRFDSNNNPDYLVPAQLDEDESRQLNTFRPDSFESHDHPIKDKGHEHPIMVLDPHSATSEVTVLYGWQRMRIGLDKLVRKATTGITVEKDNNGGQETAPKNVSVIYYIKIN